MQAHFRTSTLLLASLAFITGEAQTPSFTWARQRDLTISFGAIDPQPPFLVCADEQGTALLVGLGAWHRNYSADAYGELAWTRYDTDGNVVAQWTMPGNAVCRNVRFAPDGTILMMSDVLDSLQLDADHTLLNTTNAPHVLLAHLTADGAVLWMKDLSELYNVQRPSGLVVTATSEVYIGAHVNGDGRVMRFDANGDLLLQLTQDVEIRSIDVDADGSVFVTGGCVSMSGGQFNGTPFVPTVTGNGYNRYLARYTPQGDAVFVNFVGDVTCEYTEVECDGSGGAYWAGDLIDQAQFGTTILQGPSTGSTPAFHLARVDAAGEYLWAVEGPAGTPNGAGMGRRQFLDRDVDGNPVVSGLLHGTMDWGGGLIISSTGYYGAYAASYDPEGQLRWVKNGNGVSGVVGQSACASTDGSVYMAGLARGTCTFDADTLNGAQQWYPFIARLAEDLSTAAPELHDGSALLPYPQPAADRLFIRDLACGASVQLLDLHGRPLCAPFHYPATGIPIGSLSPGVYVVRSLDGARSFSARFVKR